MPQTRNLMTTMFMAAGLSAAAWGQTCTPSWTNAGADLLGWEIPDPVILAMTEFDPDGPGPQQRDLYMSGAFAFDGIPDRANIAKWNGFNWEDVGAAASGALIAQRRVYELLAGPDIARADGSQALYLTGTFTSVNGSPARLVAKWDGSAWSTFGDLPNIVVWGVTLHDFDGPAGPEPLRLVIGGVLIPAANQLTPGIRYWDGAVWQPVGGPSRCHLKGLISFDPDGGGPAPARLIASRFDAAGGQNGLCEWRNGAWVKMANQSSTHCQLYAFDPDGDGGQPSTLYAAVVDNLLRLDEQDQWVSEGLAVSILGSAPSTADGSGSRTLFASGVQSRNQRIWKHTESGWTLFFDGGTGSCSSPYAVGGFDEDGAGPREPMLFLGGCTRSFNGIPASGIVRYGCDFNMPRCFGDANGSGIVDFNDISLVIGRWGARNQPGDIDHDGVVGMNDVVGILASWGSPCEDVAARSTECCAGESQWRARGIEDFNADGAVNIADEIWAIANAGLDPRSPFGRSVQTSHASEAQQ